MMRSGYPHYMSGWYTVFKCLRLAFYQRCQRCGVSIGRLAHLGVGVVIDPFPLTVTDRKNGKRTKLNSAPAIECPTSTGLFNLSESRTVSTSLPRRSAAFSDAEKPDSPKPRRVIP